MMPRYEYACTNCDYQVELTHSIKEADDTRMCRICGYRLTRVVTPAPIHFKGTGYYSKDKHVQ